MIFKIALLIPRTEYGNWVQPLFAILRQAEFNEKSC